MGQNDQNRLSEEELERKLDELDRKLTPAYLRKRLKLALYRKVEAGDIAALDDIRRLETLESSASPGPAPDGAGASSETYPGATEARDTSGIPEHLLIRPRKYTLSEAALKQRQDAANSPAKTEAMLGNANAWKTGEFARSRIRQIFRPCLSTCPNYPCELIDEGETAAGSICLDKKSFVRSLLALQKAMRSGDLTDLKDLAALQIAGGMEVVSLLIDDITTYGTLIKSEKWNKDGVTLGYEIKNNPSLLPLAKLMEVLNLSPAEMMVTPREIRRQKTEAKKARTLGDIMSGIGLAARAGETDEDGDD
jgi:hypothetical protein